MSAFLRHQLGKLRDQKETDEGIARLNRLLLSYGITSVHDAGADNDLARWDATRGIQSSGRLQCRVTMLAGASHLEEFLTAGRRWGDGDQWLRLGHAKAMLSLTTGALLPDINELGRMVHEAHQSGFPVAVHAVEQEAVTAAAQVLHSNPSMPNDRIEHCAECPPELAAQIGHRGTMVVTQPGFIFWNGDRYRQRVHPALLNSLYPVASLDRHGVSVVFGSDSPVIDPNPWPGIYSAVTGCCGDGRPLSGNHRGGPSVCTQKVPIESALRMYTIAGAYADGTQKNKGTIRPGKLADLVLVDRDPTAVDQEDLKDIHPVLTMVGGQVAWEAG